MNLTKELRSKLSKEDLLIALRDWKCGYNFEWTNVDRQAYQQICKLISRKVSKELIRKITKEIVVNIFDREYTTDNSRTQKAIIKMLQEAGLEVEK